uniref:CWC15 spliceosome associated protein homolog n=1 Tax=Scophthalmus maximus TaxID=52904 RepID=A0A8D3E0W8_SCOMX
MTTAARPTFEPARGGRGKGEGDLSALSKQYSSRDLPGHTKIKYRQPTQDAPEEVRARDFRRELEERERVVARDKTRERGPRGGMMMLCSKTRSALSTIRCALSSTRNLWRNM